MKNRRKLPSRICALALVLSMLLSFGAPQAAAAGDSLSWTQVDNGTITAGLPMDEARKVDTASPYAETDMLRVSIFLEEAPTISNFAAENIAMNQAALDYRAGLEARQEAVAQAISAKALDGQKLDVVWNLTLAANVISANVEYGQIQAIEQVPGVEKVLIETRYDPAVVDTDLPVDPNMATSSSMIGSGAAWSAGYTGAGTRIAVIDTGTDTNHQSFSASGFDFSLEKQAELAGKTVADYNLLDVDEIAGVLDQLHVHEIRKDLKASQLYLSTKLPFAFNYVDKDLDVTHDNDTQSEHGSHVAGIATANTYIPNGDGTFSKALDTVQVQGVAPDAQLITLKVFGKSGGAYDSDYLAALEDAIVLNCDAVNMSLGSASPGMTRESDEAYQEILDNLANCGVVVSLSAGNAGSWVESAENGGYLYSDDVNMDMVGSPGSYTNSLCVASMDNAGATGAYFTVGGETVVYTEATSYRNKALSTLVGTRDYILIDGVGTEEDFSAIAGVLDGKIAVCARGSLSFAEKANHAVGNGAAAVIVYNNQSGVFGMDLTGYSYTAPCVSVTQSDGDKMRQAAVPVKDAGGNILYYQGTLTVEEGMGSSLYGLEYNTISSFSSWGVPGSLELKPEISAPGGNIYSVNGQDTSGTAYENMSGTSMAAPQVAGMAALVAQYIREKGLAEKTGLTPRQLAQSLLMSTAVPQMEDYGGGESGYYPVLRQGSGLANVGKVLTADSYILMGADATASYADGKVKVELGDDPERTGTYTFSFTIHNLTAEEKTYALSASFFTQAVFTGDPDGDGVQDDYMSTRTTPLETDVTFDVGQSVTVPAGGSAAVNVTAKLTGSQKAALNESHPKGAYIQGYVYAGSGATAEGVEGTEHSIPVLGFYGSWSEPSMFERGSRMEYITGEETRLPYLGSTSVNTAVIVYAGNPGSAYYFGGNPLVTDSRYMPERNAINSKNGDQIRQVMFSPIRNAGASRATVENLTTGKSMLELSGGTVSSAFYYSGTGTWQWTATAISTKFVPTGAAEGDRLELAVTLAPEYYVDSDGNADWEALGQGASLTIPMVVDNTAPELTDVQLSDTGDTITVKARDNRYVAAVVLYNASGTTVVAETGAKQDIKAGEEALYTLDLTGIRGKSFLLQVFDYAMNATTYQVKRESSGDEELPELMAFQAENLVWVGLNSADNYDVIEWSASQQTFVAAAQVDDLIFAATDRGNLYVTSPDDLAVETLVSNMGAVLTDMAYDKSTGTLYGITGNHLVTVDKLTGALTDLGEIPLRTNTLACDGNGTFYSAVHGDSSDVANRGFVYAYTLDTLYSSNLNYDFDGDGNVDTDDGQAILDYAVGARSTLENQAYADFDGSGKLTSRDAYLFLEKLNAGELGGTPRQVSSKTRNNVKSLVWNPNNGHLYGVLYTTTRTNSHAYFYEIDPETGVDTSLKDFRTETAALLIPERAASGSWSSPTDAVSGMQISNTSMRLLKGSSRTLSAVVQPWTVTDRSVTWSSANPEIAAVDGQGVITGVTPGQTVITATSVLDASVKATCTVTVEALDVTLKGALQDENGNPMLFTWNMKTDNTWTPGPALETSLASAAYDGVTGRLYIQDSTDNGWYMHQVDPATGKDTAVSRGSCSFQFAMSDLAALELFNTEEAPGMIGVVHSYLMSPCAPMDNTFNYGWDLSDYLAGLTGATSFVAAASMGASEDEDGVLCDLIRILDDQGYMWSFWYDGSDSISFDIAPTELKLRFPTHNNYQYCSMVAGDDGNLYLSYFTGETNEFYRLVWDGEQALFTADRIGDVGEDVWPAALYAVETNEAAPDAAPVVGILDEVITLKAQVMECSPMSEAQPSEDGKTVAVTVTAKNGDGADTASHNGMAVVSYDASALELTDVEVSGDYTAEVTGDGAVTFGYVSLEGIAAGEPVARLTFAVKGGKPAVTQITVAHQEVNDTALDLTEQLSLGCAHAHTEVRDAKPATETEDGYTGDTYCTDCGLLLDAGQVIPATGHQCATLAFTDLRTDRWYHLYTDYVLDHGLMVGMGGSKFAPNGTVTRAMIVTTLYRMAGEPEVSEKSTFTDVPANRWYTDAIAWAQDVGVAQGITATAFHPNDSVTREQAAAFLYRYVTVYLKTEPAQGADLSVYKDAGKISAYAKEAVAWATAEEIFQGFEDGSLQPQGTLTRVQLAKLLTILDQKF